MAALGEFGEPVDVLLLENPADREIVDPRPLGLRAPTGFERGRPAFPVTDRGDAETAGPGRILTPGAPASGKTIGHRSSLVLSYIGAPAPDFELSIVANGEGSVHLEDLKGSVVVLTFFASW